jgi:hypothetical protein
MKKDLFILNKGAVIFSVIAVLAFLVFITSCMPVASEMSSISTDGLPAIQSITAQVIENGAISPTTIPPIDVTPGDNLAPTPGGEITGTPAPTTAPGPTSTITPEPSGTDVMISIEVSNFKVVDKLGQAGVEGEAISISSWMLCRPFSRGSGRKCPRDLCGTTGCLLHMA